MSSEHDVILVSHAVHAAIDEDDARAALPSSWTVRGFVEVAPALLTLDDTLEADWLALARHQEQLWRERAEPVLQRYGKACIAYFGLAPIPLAIHLGALVGRFRSTVVFQRHHVSRKWAYEGGAAPKIRKAEGPKEPTRSTEPALILVSTTVPADLEAARRVVGASSTEVTIGVDPLGEDVLCTPDVVEQVADAFREGLELLEVNRPAVSEVHLIAAVPCGLAFLMGTRITSTRHAQVVSYQYHRSAEVRLQEALRIPLRGRPSQALTPEQLREARNLRVQWEQARAGIAEFASNRPAMSAWFEVLGSVGDGFRFGGWARLQPARDTPIVEPIDTQAGDDEPEFRRASTGGWIIGAPLLAAILSHVSAANHARTGRMLLLHEALHHGKQGLMSATARQVRFLPKVLEELDYQADVWTVVHELAFSGDLQRPWQQLRGDLLAIIETAVATMWAFDADAEPGVLEVRRVNRYLIWYATLARLEQASDLAAAVSVLAQKPVIELAGPPTALRDGRLVMLLDRPSPRPTELSFLDADGCIVRLGDTNASSPSALAGALGRRNGGAARELLRELVSGQLVR